MASTCEWIVDRPWFQDWSSSSFSDEHAKVLWINGPAGFGKSVLCTKVIDHLSSTSQDLSSASQAPVAHFFFSTDIEREDPYVAIRSWVSQVISHPAAFSLVRERWVAQERQKATRGDVVSLLREIVTTIPGCTLIIDGLDECIWLKGTQATTDDDLIPGFIGALMQATAESAARVMIVSRDEPEIRTCLHDRAQGISLFEHKITPGDVQPDVLSYSSKLVRDELRKSTDAAKESLSQKLADRCNGQFLWVKLQQKPLRRNSWKSHKELERVINSTPTGLDDIYERNWVKILKLPDEDRDRALSLLRWAAFAVRPLTVAEMTEALLISEDCDEIQVDQLPESIDMDYIDNGISFYCGSLLDIRSPHAECDDGEKTIHLAHFSVKQYLLYNFPKDPRFLQLDLSPGSFTEHFEHTLLSKMCVRYLNSPGVLREHGEDDPVLNAFFDYAAASWTRHSSIAGPSKDSAEELVKQLFDTTRPNWELWREWYDSNDRAKFPNRRTIVENPSSPLCYAIRVGSIDTARFLIHNREDCVDEKTFSGMTALTIACAHGNLRIPGLLLDNGAEINAASDYGWTPIMVASECGHPDLVEFLLENEADINFQNTDGWTPLMVATEWGHPDVVEILLENGADTEIRDKHGWTPAMAASARGEVAIVKSLLENGANMEFKTSDRPKPEVTDDRNNNGLTPAMAASSFGRLDVIKLLFEHGVDMDTRSEDGWTAAMTAAEYGHLAVVKFLFENGVDLEVRNDKGWTAAILASAGGHLDVLRFLIESGLDVRSKTDAGWTPATNASSHGMVAVVKLLLDSGVDMEAPVDLGWTPISIAASEGHVEVVKLLLEHGVNINVADDKGCRPLHFALSGGHLAVVKLLLEKGVDFEAPNSWGLTPVTYASAYGHVEVVKLLLEYGPDLNVPDTWGSTALHHAASDGITGMVALLLESGAEIHVSEVSGWTPLHHACSRGNLETAKLLLQFSAAGLDLPEKTGRTPLYLAAIKGHSDVVRLLLSYNALTNVKDCYNTRALGAAIRNGCHEVVGILLAATHTASELEDELGHSVVWWATSYQQDNTIKLLWDWVKKMGIESMDRDFSWDGILLETERGYRRCSVCVRLTFNDCAYYYCTVCPEWQVCLECHGIDGKSFHTDHEWALWEPDGSLCEACDGKNDEE